MSWLSPGFVDAVIDGVQPRSINRTRLFDTELPVAWEEQEKLLGFTA